MGKDLKSSRIIGFHVEEKRGQMGADHNGEKGFTLIELLIVVAIVGILAATAVPLVSEYRNRAYASLVKSDVRIAYEAILIWFGENPGVVNCPSVAGVTGPASNLSADYPRAAVSDGVTITVTGGSASTFQVSGSHSRLGAGNIYQINGNGTIVDNLL